MRRVLFPIVMLVLLAVPAAAQGARRYAAPNGSNSSPQCAPGDPCRIDRAVNSAAAGDEIVVAPGTYAVSTPLRPRGAVDLHGDGDHAAPRLVGDTSMAASLLTLRGGTLGHLSLEATASKQEALTLQGGIADGVRLLSAAGRGGTVSGSGTVLRNSVVRADTGGLDVDADNEHATVTLRNVTVMALGAKSTGIQCSAHDGDASLVNVLVRGGASDVVAITDDGECTAAFSNFRPAFSSGLAPGTGNQSAEPLFADGDYRPAAGSPTIDAGALDAFASSPDPDGRSRTIGAAPDIGAYEYAPATTGDAEGPSKQLPEALQGLPLPTQGVSVLVAPARGTVRVREPGAAGFAVLEEPGRIPVGSLVDARRGRVRLVTAIDAGRVQSGLFWGSKFKTGQRRTGGGMTTLTLRGGNFAACRARSARTALAVASRKRKRKPRRSLWARDNGGRFRTHGNDSVATARGTAWVTRDTCRGTLTRVTEGAVSVRDLARHKRVLVKAGHSYLARARR